MTQTGYDVAALRSRLDRTQDERHQIPPDDPKRRQRRRRILQVAGAWAAGGAMLVGGLVLFSLSSAERSEHQAVLDQRMEPIAQAQDRIYVADETQGLLPDTAQAERWLSQADGAARSMTSAQNTYLQETGPVDPTRASVFEDSIPGHIEADPDHPDREDYRRTDDQRMRLAEDDRDNELSGLSRLLASHIDERLLHDSQWVNEFDPTQRWHNAVTTVDDEDGAVSMQSYQWRMETPELYRPDGSIPVVWRLVYHPGATPAESQESEAVDEDTAPEQPAEVVAVMSAEYNPQSRVIEQFELHNVAGHEQEGS